MHPLHSLKLSQATFLAAFLLLLAGCTHQPKQDPPPATLIVPDQGWQGETTIRATGVVELAAPVDLSFPLSGQIAQMLVREGSTVHQGDVLARLDTTLLEDDVAAAQGALAVEQANLDAAVARTDPGLLSLPGSAAVARAQVAHGQIVVDMSKARLAQATLIAPMDGTVIGVYARQHEFSPEGKPVVQLADTTSMQVRVNLDEGDAAGVAVGDPAEVTFDIAPGARAKGQVSAITPQNVSGGTPRFTVTIDLSQVPDTVRWGFSASVLISTR